jgi:hypothetical protein
MADYRPFHEQDCPARNPDISPEQLRIIGDAVVAVQACSCPRSRFGPGSQPIPEPGDER